MLRLVAAAAALFVCSSAAFARAPEPVTLTPLSHNEAALAVRGGNGVERSFTPADLEKLPTYRMETTTPWRDAPAVFEGVLLRDLLAETGLSDLPAILVTAENDYTAVIPRAVWEDTDMMVVTRVDGAAHTRRARGPIQFLVDAETYAEGLVTESHLVWMAARIEAAE